MSISNDLSNEEASQFLSTSPGNERPKAKANHGLFEEYSEPSFERECLEQKCSKQEIQECLNADPDNDLYNILYNTNQKGKTNIKANNNGDKGFIADFAKLQNFPCDYYHSRLQEKGSANSRNCNKLYTLTCEQNYLKKSCICKKSKEGYSISAGPYCNQCHSNCKSKDNHGNCQSIDDFHIECVCDKAVIFSSNNYPFGATTLPNSGWRHQGHQFCSQPIDHCTDYTHECDPNTTVCEYSENTVQNGYKCVCRDGYESTKDPRKCEKIDPSLPISAQNKNTIDKKTIVIISSSGTILIIILFLILLLVLKKTRSENKKTPDKETQKKSETGILLEEPVTKKKTLPTQ